jgi:hypothetical protein
MGALVLFTNVCGGIVVVPDVAAPVISEGGVHVQVIVAPGVGDVKLTILLFSSEQTV